MSKAQHTPISWELITIDGFIGIGKRKNNQAKCQRVVDMICNVTDMNASIHNKKQVNANAAYIVRACNAHDELLFACKAMLLTWGSQDEDAIIEARNMARAAINKAEGGAE